MLGKGPKEVGGPLGYLKRVFGGNYNKPQKKEEKTSEIGPQLLSNGGWGGVPTEYSSDIVQVIRELKQGDEGKNKIPETNP